MPKRQYHNLDGLLRDGLACFQAEGDEAAWERLVALARFISDVLDVLDSSMDDDPEGEGSDAPLDVRDVGDGSPLGGADAGHGPVRSDDLGLAPGLGDPMERVRALAAPRSRHSRSASFLVELRLSPVPHSDVAL